MSESIQDMGALFIVFDHDEGPHNVALAARLSDRVDLYYQLTFDDADQPGSEQYFHRIDGHWNVDGNRMAAQEMCRALHAARLFERSDNRYPDGGQLMPAERAR